MSQTAKCIVLLGLLIWVPGCSGSQWDKRLVAGSTGPVWEIRSSRQPDGVQGERQQMAIPVDPQAKTRQIQDQLMQQAARMAVADFKDYQVGPEDLLQITFLDADKLNTEARVDGQGQIRLLLVGDVRVGGLSTAEIARKLSDLYRKGQYLTNPQVSVDVKDYRHMKVAVTGAVSKPDFYALIGPRTLLEVLGMAGGLSDKASQVVHVIRPRSMVQSSIRQQTESLPPPADTMIIDLNQLLIQGEVQLNIPVQNGDVIHVPFAQTAFVLGAVMKPGSVLLKDNMTVTKAIAETGGLHIMLSSWKATILRQDDKGARSALAVDIQQITRGSAEDIPLQENDIVYVHESAGRRFFFDFKAFFPGSFPVNPGTW